MMYLKFPFFLVLALALLGADSVIDGPMLQHNDAVTSAPAQQVIRLEASWHKLPPHPRLFANAARFAALRAQSDPVSRELLALLRHDAEQALTGAKIIYPATGFKFDAVRKVQGRILTLALGYRLGGDKRLLERARQELLALAALPDWCPSHFLDVGEAALAAAIGLDWLYDELTPAEREQIATSIVNNALAPSLAVTEGSGSWVDGDFNWNQVCHGGLIAGALAVAEREPELARRIVARAIKNLPKAGAVYAPDGVYPEGPNYWSYGTTFHVLAVEALRSTLGSSFDLEKAPGFLNSADFMEQAVAPSGQDFNFSDYHERPKSEPVLLWFARELGRRSAARQELENLSAMQAARLAGKTEAIRPTRHLGFELLWWDPALTRNIANAAPPLHWTGRGVTPLAVMRSAWNDPRATYVGVKGGSPNHSHGHMDAGSFVLEADGVRWALDLGAESYDKMRAAKLTLWSYAQDSSRWNTFRVGPEGHNILRFDGARQRVEGQAAICALPDENGSVGNLVDLTPIYRDQARRVQRRVRLHANRSVSIEDEWTVGAKPTQVTWQWLTLAQVTATADGALLRQQGETLSLRITEGSGAQVSIEDVAQPKNKWDSPNPGLCRIVIQMQTPAASTGRLSVLAEPGNR